jgi:excisionase family DNA binding protein
MTKMISDLPTPSPRLRTVGQAAQYLSTTPWAIRRMAWSKELPYLRIGQRMLFDVRDLDIFIDNAKDGTKFGTVAGVAR